MAFSGGDSRCVLGTHPHTLPCLSVGVMAAGAWSTAAAAGVLERDEAPNEQKRPLPLDEIKMADECCFVAFASFIAKNAACRCPTGCLHSAPFEALRSFIQCDATIIMAPPSSPALSVTIRMTAKRAMSIMVTTCTERRIICASLYKNPRRV
ncbi:hypothetical protein TcG_11163 [Trypanosoma cruzi]|nr:hypothetical protein TcG_11163 [Trypanosoma cruzi]